jgi:uncharacterized small protein (TIGR04563 family)
MAPSDKGKRSFQFSADMLAEIVAEAHRLDRSVSWVVRRAWRIARRTIKKIERK